MSLKNMILPGGQLRKDFIVSASPVHLCIFLPTYFIHNVYFILLRFVKLVFNITAFLLENKPLIRARPCDCG